MLNAQTLDRDFLEALQYAWSKQAAYPACQDDYDEKHPSWGNCLVSSLAAWSVFGGELMAGRVDNNAEEQKLWHFRLGNIDLTWEQFDEGAVFHPVTSAEQPFLYKEIIQGSLWDDETLEDRLATLINDIEYGGYDMPQSASEIIASIQDQHRFVFSHGYNCRIAPAHYHKPS